MLAPQTPEVLPLYYQIALKELGVREIKGNAHNARILEFHKATSYKATADEVAWCSAFVNWCLKEAGIEGTNNAAARSFLRWGEATKTPKKGDICVFKRGSSPWQGHVGFYAGETETHILVLGGNQGDEVCIKKYPKEQLIEIRRVA